MILYVLRFIKPLPIFLRKLPIMANDPRQEIINGLEFWNLSDAWLAERSGYSAQNIGNWIRRGRSPLDAEVWDRLIDCLPQKELTGPLIPVSFPLAKLPYAGVDKAGRRAKSSMVT